MRGGYLLQRRQEHIFDANRDSQSEGKYMQEVEKVRKQRMKDRGPVPLRLLLWLRTKGERQREGSGGSLLVTSIHRADVMQTLHGASSRNHKPTAAKCTAICFGWYI